MIKKRSFLASDEEARLLAACTGKREYLRPMLVCLIDTGLRRSEMLALKWADIDLDARLITVRPEVDKVLRGRVVPISGRLNEELLKLRGKANALGGFAFPQGDFRRAFYNVCRDAGIEGLRVADLRRIQDDERRGAEEQRQGKPGKLDDRKVTDQNG
ncbi:MAG: site-specific integrase [Acidobacteria bacterium]|nr:site-specific integrase [Acidobacteriota bacterium]